MEQSKILMKVGVKRHFIAKRETRLQLILGTWQVGNTRAPSHRGRALLILSSCNGQDLNLKSKLQHRDLTLSNLMLKLKYHILSEVRFHCKRVYSIKLMWTNHLTQPISFQVFKTPRNQSFHSVTSRINLKRLGSLSRSSTVQAFKVIIK